MTIGLKLAIGVNFLRNLTSSGFLIQNSQCLLRYKHESSHDRPPGDLHGQIPHPAEHPNVKDNKKKFPAKSPPKTQQPKPTPKKKLYVPPNIILFHSPESALSLRAKKILEDAQFAFPNTRSRIGTPLPLKLTIHERLPTVDEIRDTYLLLEDQDQSWSKFLTLHSSAFHAHPTNAASILEIVQKYREHKLISPQDHEKSSSPKLKKPADEEDPADESLFDIKAVTLPPTHSLFGTECFSWPVILWNSKVAQVAPGWRAVTKQLYKYSRIRDGILSPEELREAKEEAKERALQERIKEKLKAREVSPEEGDTLRWYNESSGTRNR